MRIMYVEDNMVNLALVERVARMGGHTIVSFTNGTDALKALATDPADLILMDIELEGELDGMEVTRQLRSRGDKRPIIAVTAYAMRGDKERILESGCDAYLPKPIPIAEFLELLAKYDPANAKPEPVAPLDVVEAAPKVIRGGTAPLPPAPPEPAKPTQDAATPPTEPVAVEKPPEAPALPADIVVSTERTPIVVLEAPVSPSADVNMSSTLEPKPPEMPITPESENKQAVPQTEAASSVTASTLPQQATPVEATAQPQPSMPEANDSTKEIPNEPVITPDGQVLSESKDD